jgi:transcriptional regulator with XRE-family HTH domain
MTRVEEMRAKADDGMTYQQIADAYGISRQRVAQILGRYSSNRHRPERTYSIYPGVDRWMHENKMTYTEVARQLGYAVAAGTLSRINRIFTGVSEMNKSDIDKLINLAGKTYEELFGSINKTH